MKPIREFMNNSNIDRDSELWAKAEASLQLLGQGKTPSSKEKAFIERLYMALECLSNCYYDIEEDKELMVGEVQRTVSVAEDMVRLAIEQAKESAGY